MGSEFHLTSTQNKQIDVAMNSALASRPLAKPSTKLSQEGQDLVKDLRDVIEKANLLLLSKNEGNLIQDFIYQCTKTTTGDAKAPTAPVDKATAQQHGNEALEGLRTLGQLLISNGQFRKLRKSLPFASISCRTVPAYHTIVNDAVTLLRDMAGDGATSAATTLKPSEEKLSTIDHPAEDNTWHDVPDLSPAAIRSQVKDQYGKNKPFGKQGAADAVADAQGQPTTTDAVETGGTALKERASTNVPEDTKNNAREAFDKSKDYLAKKVPKERREQTIWRLKKMVVEVQGHQDCEFDCRVRIFATRLIFLQTNVVLIHCCA